MNKILSQALKKAVSEYSPEVKEVSKSNRPDLFSLNNETELFQNDKGIIIKIDRSKDANLTDFGKATLKDRYLGHNESFQDLFASSLILNCRLYRTSLLYLFEAQPYLCKLWLTHVPDTGSTLLLLFLYRSRHVTSRFVQQKYVDIDALHYVMICTKTTDFGA